MKKNFLKKLVTGILAATLGVTALAGCGSAKTADKGDKVYRTLDEIKDSGEINIGVFSDKNPFGYVDDNGDNSIVVIPGANIRDMMFTLQTGSEKILG